MPDHETVDILIIGSGMGGATCAAGLAHTGVRIVILERGKRLPDSVDARDARAIFQRGVFRPEESWLDGVGRPFNPGNYYYVGGNTKLYGAVLIRYRAQDFEPISYREGTTAGWPFSYDELEPWYSRAEKLYKVRGALGFDRTEPRHSEPYPFGPVPDEPAIAKVRERMKRVGLQPVSVAARHRHRQMAATREDAVGRLSGYGERQDGRRELRPQRGAGSSERRAA